MIKLQSVGVEIDGRSILQDISLDMDEKRIGIIGLNGSGKSTFVRLINGLQAASSGVVSVDELNPCVEGRKVRRKVGFVFQNPENQIVYPTVLEDLAFGLKNLKLGKAEIQQKIKVALEEYNLTHLSNRFTHQLSGGEKQMIALLGVMIMIPEYIILDEPTTLLDLKNKRHLMSVVGQLKQTVLMVTHDLDLLIGFDRVLCFHDGRLIADDTPERAQQKYLAICGEC